MEEIGNERDGDCCQLPFLFIHDTANIFLTDGETSIFLLDVFVILLWQNGLQEGQNVNGGTADTSVFDPKIWCNIVSFVLDEVNRILLLATTTNDC